MNRGLFTFIPDLGMNLLGILYIASLIVVVVIAVSIPWPVRWYGFVPVAVAYLAIVVIDLACRLRTPEMSFAGRLFWPDAGGVIALIPAWLWFLVLPLCVYWFR